MVLIRWRYDKVVSNNFRGCCQSAPAYKGLSLVTGRGVVTKKFTGSGRARFRLGANELHWPWLLLSL